MKRLFLIILFVTGCAGFQAQDLNTAIECTNTANLCYANLKAAVELEDPAKVLDVVNDCLQTWIDSDCSELIEAAKEAIENAKSN